MRYVDPADRSSVHVSRRQFLAAAAAATTATMLPTDGLFAAESLVDQMRKEAATATITVEKIRGNVSAILGSGGNIGVLSGKDGKLLVDAGMAGSKPKIADALAQLGAEPVRHLINTHWHFDHTDGNEWLHAAGATIMAHRNTRERLSHETRVDAWDYSFPPSPAGALPTEFVEGEKTLSLNGTSVAIKYYGPAHTDGDLCVHLATDDVLHLGDTFWNGFYPFIDYSTGGSIDAMIRAADANVSRAGAKTAVIPGHGPLGDRSHLIEFRDMLASIREAVASLMKQGKSLDEAIAAKPTAKFDAKWGGFIISPDIFVRLVYAGV